MFYDAAEECDKSSDPCITTFKYFSDAAEAPHNPDLEGYRCPDNVKEHNISWGSDGFLGRSPHWLEIANKPQILYSENVPFTLKWQNNNPDYPTTVTWRWAGGAGSFYMYKVIDAGKTELEIQFNRIAELMLPGTGVPANGTEADRNITKLLVDFMGDSRPLVLAVGQPEDPKYEDKHLKDKNVTDMSKPFSLMYSDYAGQVWFSQQGARDYISHKKEDWNRKWGIGVGVGVGVGGPILVAVTYYLGRRDGKKLATTIKRSNDINMADQPG
ncbi:hypothetical protein K4F52_005476 [Lecanicillium sp. MT-2017a]|nr:hypothetical protein K4F52_005476 [Lecanicillium sp. MT-2017a]